MDERRERILEAARQTGVVQVDALVNQLGVSAQTIRKDLNRLCQERLLARTHGGARLASSLQNMSYAARRVLAAEHKRAIGQAVALLVPDAASLFINIGTTTEAVARALLQHRQLMVITNNLNVAALMHPHDRFEVLIASGVVRASDGGIVGEAAVEFIRQFRVDVAVIGVSAIAESGELLDFDYREVKVAQAIIENAHQVILVADSSKHERHAPVRIAHLSQMHTFVTDRCPSQEFRERLQAMGVKLVETRGAAPRHSPG